MELSPTIRAVFDAAPAPARAGMFALRALIVVQARRLPQIGQIAEALRWGQPAYLTPETGAACSLRIGPLRDGGFGLFVHCRTTLIETFRAGPGAGMRTDGTRAVLFRTVDEIAEGPVGGLIDRALTWHLAAPERRVAGSR